MFMTLELLDPVTYLISDSIFLKLTVHTLLFQNNGISVY